MLKLLRVLFVLSVAMSLSMTAHAQDVQAKIDKDRARVIQNYKLSLEHHGRGANKSSEAFAQKAYMIGGRVFPEKSLEMGKITLNYIRGLIYGHSNKAAERIAKEKLPLIIEIFGRDSQEHITMVVYQGHAILDKSHGSKSQKYYATALSMTEKQSGKKSFEYGTLQFDIATRALVVNGRKYGSTMLKNSRNTLSGLDTQIAKDKLIELLFWEGKLYLAKQKYTSAETTFLEVMNILQKDEEKELMALSAMAFLVQVYESTRKKDLASTYAHRIGEARAAKGIRDSQPIYQPRIKYPRNARRKEGTVKVRYMIDDKGYPIDVTVVSSDITKPFEVATIEGIKKFRYAPRYFNGKAVKSGPVNYSMDWNKDR